MMEDEELNDIKLQNVKLRSEIFQRTKEAIHQAEEFHEAVVVTQRQVSQLQHVADGYKGVYLELNEKLKHCTREYKKDRENKEHYIKKLEAKLEEKDSYIVQLEENVRLLRLSVMEWKERADVKKNEVISVSDVEDGTLRAMTSTPREEIVSDASMKEHSSGLVIDEGARHALSLDFDDRRRAAEFIRKNSGNESDFPFLPQLESNHSKKSFIHHGENFRGRPVTTLTRRKMKVTRQRLRPGKSAPSPISMKSSLRSASSVL